MAAIEPMVMTPELSIIILNYRSRGLVRNCLQSLLEADLPSPFEIIVVDNASHDGTEAMIKEQFANAPIKFVAADANRGMGAGNNLGARHATGKYLFIANPDIFVFNDTVKKMWEYLKSRPDVGVLAPRLLNPDRSLQYTCYRWHSAWTPAYRRTLLGKLPWARKELVKFLMTDWDHTDTREVDWIQGSCWLVPKEVYDKLGGFDENFFMYFEDTDFCRRVKEAGLKNIYHADSEVIHLHGRQSLGGLLQILFNRMTREHIKSWVKYLRKWRQDL